MTRKTIRIGTGRNEIVVTVRREPENKRHIIITVPHHMKWITIWKTMRKLPEHLQNEREQLRKKKKLRKENK